MNGRAVPVPLWLLAAAGVLVVGAALRLGALGHLPPDEAEARSALGAVAASPQPSPFWEPEVHGRQDAPAYHVLTAALFGFIGASDAAARAVPALAGLALVLTPFLLRRELGTGGALVASALLALSPILVRGARSAGGAPLALLGLVVFALSMRRHGGRVPLWGMLGLALALASGPAGLTGLMVLGLAAGAAKALRANLVDPEARSQGAPHAALLGGLAALLLLGSGFGLRPEALAGLGESLGAWALGWVRGEGAGPGVQLLALLAYEPLILGAGIAGGALLLARRHPLGPPLAIVAAAGLVVALAYPGSAPIDWAWAVYPLALLGGAALARLAARVGEHASWEHHGAPVTALLVLAAVAGQHLAAYAGGRGPSLYAADPGLSLGLAGAIVLLGVVLIVLTAAAWSQEVAVESAALGALALLLVGSLSAGWRLNFVAPAEGQVELWSRRTPGVGVRMLVDTLQTLSQAQTGLADALAVALDPSAPADLRWALRAFRAAPPGTADSPAPAVLVPADGPPPVLAAEYIGQTLEIARRGSWQGVGPIGALQWVFTRAGDSDPDRWLVLVRADLASLGAAPAGHEPEAP